MIDRDTLLNEIMTTVEDLVSDPSQHVRAALGTQISGLAPLLGKQEYVNEVHLESMMQLLTMNSGQSTIFSQCSSKCSRMNTLTFACI